MTNPENLIPVTKRSQEEAKKISSKGGIARGKQRKEEKTLKEKYNFAWNILSKKVSDNTKDHDLKKILDGTDLLVFEQLNVILNPESKDETRLKAIENIQDRLYGKPVSEDKLDITTQGKAIIPTVYINTYKTNTNDTNS